MNFNLRLPIGLMFSLFAAILTVCGLISSPEICQRSLGINVNLWWGAGLLILSLLLMRFFALRKSGHK
jgi:hypothetical protein